MSESEAVVMVPEMLAGEGEHAGQDWARLAALVIADELTSHDLNVRSPDRDESQHLKVTNLPGTLCHISVAADGLVELERWPIEGHQTDPACIAMAVLKVLGADTASVAAFPVPGYSCAVSFKGAVARILADHGMSVTVRACPDQEFFEVYSDIEVANPALPERGMVYVADDSSFLWRCRTRAMPKDKGVLDPAQIAGIIARAVTGTDHPGARLLHDHLGAPSSA